MKIKESKKRDKYLDLAREQRKLWNMGVMVTPIVIGAVRKVPKGLEMELIDLETGGQTTNYSIFEISQNTEKSPGDLKRVTVS